MIADIYLENFRSYKDDSFEFSPAVNIIVGPNASGKTNLLEAILMLSSGSSYRAKDSELISFGEPWSKIVAHAIDGKTRELRLKTEGELTQKNFIIDDKTFKRLALLKTLPIVLFEPNHLQMLVGPPELRRGFLDGIIAQIRPGYNDLLRQYKRVLAQRNRILKNGHGQRDQLFVWDVRLSELGSKIAKARFDLVEEFNKEIEKLYQELSSQKTEVAVSYLATVPIKNYASDLFGRLEESATLDFERGFTAAGPHREDMRILINGGFLPDVASRGETRTMTLVFKILEAKLIEAAREQVPMLLLDDVFSELDGARRQALTRFLQAYQTFITTTDADVVIQHFTEEAKIIPISRR